jgi:hypothetical protein
MARPQAPEAAARRSIGESHSRRNSRIKACKIEKEKKRQSRPDGHSFVRVRDIPKKYEEKLESVSFCRYLGGRCIDLGSRDPTTPRRTSSGTDGLSAIDSRPDVALDGFVESTFGETWDKYCRDRTEPCAVAQRLSPIFRVTAPFDPFVV